VVNDPDKPDKLIIELDDLDEPPVNRERNRINVDFSASQGQGSYDQLNSAGDANYCVKCGSGLYSGAERCASCGFAIPRRSFSASNNIFPNAPQLATSLSDNPLRLALPVLYFLTLVALFFPLVSISAILIGTFELNSFNLAFGKSFVFWGEIVKMPGHWLGFLFVVIIFFIAVSGIALNFINHQFRQLILTASSVFGLLILVILRIGVSRVFAAMFGEYADLAELFVGYKMATGFYILLCLYLGAAAINIYLLIQEQNA
jgi:ribosomal protein L37E